VSIRKVNLEELAAEMLKINEALKPLNMKVLSEYNASIEQRLNDVYATGVTLKIRFIEDDE
jgi:hypothetical protein